jgi:hypothetical protein
VLLSECTMRHAHAEKIPGPRKLHRIFNLIGTVKIVVGDEVAFGRRMIEPKNTFKSIPDFFVYYLPCTVHQKKASDLYPHYARKSELIIKKINHW